MAASAGTKSETAASGSASGGASSSGGDTPLEKLQQATSGKGASGDNPLEKLQNSSKGGSESDGPDPLTWEGAWETIKDKLIDWGEGAVAMVPNFVLALLVILAFGLIGLIAQKMLTRFLSPRVRSQAAVQFGASVLKILIILVGLYAALSVLDLTSGAISLLAGAGVLGIALGFAFQDIAENLIIGLMMSVRKPFEIGDVVETKGYMGYARKISLRTTVIENFLGQEIVIQNREVYQNPLKNYSATGYRKIAYDINISYGEDLEKVVEVTKDAIEPLDFVSSRDDIEMFGMEFDSYAICFLLRVRIAYPATDYFMARHSILLAVKKAYDEHDILIPWPIRTLDFNARGGRDLSAALQDSPLAEQQQYDGNGADDAAEPQQEAASERE